MHSHAADVEAVPPEPQQERPCADEGHVVPPDLFASPSILKATYSWAHYDGACQPY
jgi:hypothetical protein